MPNWQQRRRITYFVYIQLVIIVGWKTHHIDEELEGCNSYMCVMLHMCIRRNLAALIRGPCEPIFFNVSVYSLAAHSKQT